MSVDSVINTEEMRLVQAMRALGDTNRYKMFKIMVNNQDYCVSEIASQLNISVPAVSQHFRTFELLGLVEKQRDGQRICYSLKAKDPLVKQLTHIAK
jgi:DNA-binding transcriptional ArsR family regulator